MSVILGAYDNGRLVYQSHVALGVSRQDFKLMALSPKVDKNRYPKFPDFVGAIWLEPNLVCTVEYMNRTPGGGLRQPVFRGLRVDKTPEDCVLEQ